MATNLTVFCTIRYTFHCLYCEATHTEEIRRIPFGCPVAIAGLPSSWNVLNGFPVCPNHVIEVRGFKLEALPKGDE